jgi:hypothetical protein
MAMAVEDAKYNDLGQILVELTPSETRRILLYVEFDDAVHTLFLFHEIGGDVYYLFPNGALSDELFRLQGIFGADVKAMEFELRDDRFSAQLVYADKFDARPDGPARLDAVLIRYFGHTLVRTPSL